MGTDQNGTKLSRKTQVLSADGSCQQAVDNAAVNRLVGSLPQCSTNTSAYCQARARLPEEMISTLAVKVGAMIAADVPSWWHWQGRRVCLVDGTTVLLADTPENQDTFPQPSSQKPGLGFPICRLVTLRDCLRTNPLIVIAQIPPRHSGWDPGIQLPGMAKRWVGNNII